MTTTSLGLRGPIGDSDRRRQAVHAAGRAAADWARTRRSIWAAPAAVVVVEAVEAVEPDFPAEPWPIVEEPRVVDEPHFDRPYVMTLGEPSSASVMTPATQDAFPDLTADLGVDFVVDPTGDEIEEEPAGLSFGARTLAAARALGGEGRQRLAIAAALLLVLTVGVSARGYWFKAAAVSMDAANRWAAPKPQQALPASRPVEEPAAASTGRLEVTSDPPGAHVAVDGADYGSTPLTLEGVAVGSHAVVLTTDTGSVRRAVRITANETAHVSEMIVSGWLSVFAPFDVVVTDGSNVVQPDDRGQIMLPPGPHALHFTNRELGFDELRRVTIKPGETQSLSLSPPPSKLTITASEAAEVFVDGIAAGGTPVVRPVDLGTHEVVVKGASGSEKRMTVVATVRPVDVDVTFETQRQ